MCWWYNDCVLVHLSVTIRVPMLVVHILCQPSPMPSLAGWFPMLFGEKPRPFKIWNALLLCGKIESDFHWWFNG